MSKLQSTENLTYIAQPFGLLQYIRHTPMEVNIAGHEGIGRIIQSEFSHSDFNFYSIKQSKNTMSYCSLA